jgi:hypothetical protein
MSGYKQLSDDELTQAAVTLELRLNEIESEVDILDLHVGGQGRKLRKMFRMLGLSGAAAVSGALSAPITGGWSVLAAAAPLGVAFLEMQAYVRDRPQLTALERRLAALRTEVASTSAQLERIRAELDARRRD